MRENRKKLQEFVGFIDKMVFIADMETDKPKIIYRDFNRDDLQKIIDFGIECEFFKVKEIGNSPFIEFNNHSFIGKDKIEEFIDYYNIKIKKGKNKNEV